MKRALFLLAALAAAALCACQQAPVSSDASQPSPSSQSSQAPAAGEDELLFQESVPDGSTQASVSLHVPGDPGAEASLRVCLQGTDLGGKAFQRETELSGLQFCQASYSPSGHYFIVDGVESGSEYHALYGWEVLPSGSTSYCLTGKLENACYYCASIQPKLKEAHGTWRDIHFSFVRWHEEQDRMLMEYAGTAPDDSPFGGSFWFDLETLAAIPAQSSDPDAAPQYSTVLQETSVYTLDAQGLSPEEGAYLLAGQFMDSMMEESDRRTFRITEYRDLTVTVIPTLEVDEETAGIYDLAEDELVENAWIVKICAPFLYEGTLSPVGNSAGDQWIDILYQGSPVDFLMRREGDQYTLQSRHERIYGSAP